MIKNKPTAKFWVELTNEKGEIYILSSPMNLKFPLKFETSDLYCRIRVDNNGNGFWDEADFAQNIAAEDVYILKRN